MAAQGHGHLNLVFVPIPPLIVWCLFELLITKRRPPRRIGVLLGLLAGAQALIEPELLTMLAIVVLVGLVGIAIVKRGELRQKFDHLARAAIPAIVVFAVITGYMFWMIVFGPQHIVATVGAVPILQSYRTDLLGPLLPTTQLLSSSAIAADTARFATTPIEATSYLGFAMVILVGIFATKWKQIAGLFLSALLALIAFVFSLGPQLDINGRSTGIPMPEALFSHLPLLDNIVPIRFSFVVVLFAAIAFAVGADHLLLISHARYSAAWTEKIKWFAAITVIALVILLVIPEAPFKSQAPPWPNLENAMLSVIPAGSVVLTYPLATSQDPAAMSWAANDGLRFRLITGYAIVRQSNLSTDGFPSVLAPFVVEEYLAAAQGSGIYPAPNANSNPAAALCEFISIHHVGAMIFWNVGMKSNEVKKLFRHAFGTPIRKARNGQVLVWRTAHKRCVN
jgi:hypothetical protein